MNSLLAFTNKKFVLKWYYDQKKTISLFPSDFVGVFA